MTQRTCLETFADMVQWCRPADSKTERKWINEFLEPLKLARDAAGNLYKQIGDSRRVLWSCHTDTVHRRGGKQKLSLKHNLLKSVDSDCLGADDTTGVWLMREMILAGKPGLYVFHRAEECGMIGSTWIADSNPQFLDGVQIAIALDRKGYGDVITRQMGDTCCSDAFAESLAAQLGGSYKPSAEGIFTDTAAYMKAIPECTNLSVGYFDAHSTTESQDLRFLGELRHKLINLDPDKLIIERDPKDDTTIVHWSDYSYGRDGWSRFDEYDQRPRPRSLIGLVKDHPDEVADILESYGYDPANLYQEIMQRWVSR